MRQAETVGQTKEIAPTSKKGVDGIQEIF